ncbi:hypothetical protein GQX74_000832 [Glossina fuscipes]|nr:hypothetical protein GQX74_000832 [Glossina fuscipes]
MSINAVAVIVKVLQLYCNNGKCDYFDLITSYTTTCSQCFISFGSRTNVTMKRTAAAAASAASAATLVSSSFGAVVYVNRKKEEINVTLAALSYLDKYFEALRQSIVLCSEQSLCAHSSASLAQAGAFVCRRQLLVKNLNAIDSISVSKILQLNSNKNGYESAQF